MNNRNDKLNLSKRLKNLEKDNEAFAHNLNQNNAALQHFENSLQIMAARHIDIIDAINDQDQLTVKVKKAHPNATIPTYAHASDAGLDLTAVALTRNSDGSITYHTGLALEIPTGYVGLVFPRSSLCNYDLRLTNCVGVIDSGYRGEITLRFKPTKIGRWLAKFPIFGRRFAPNIYNVGDRVGQLIVMPYPRVTLTLSDKLNTSDRGQNGYGSTGK